MKRIKFVCLGYGNRGRGYTDYCLKHQDQYEVVAIIEKDDKRLNEIDFTKKYKSIEEFLIGKVKCDIVCVATQDKDHFENAVTLLENGYDLLLEKPISDSLENCIKIEETAKKYNRKVFVCHVLRYTPFYHTIKELLLNNEIGNIINIQTQENIGFWHMAHSYVRGPWAKKEDSNPIILAKCCHDLDLICWFMDEKCLSVNSVGSLSVFKKENKPDGARKYCSECPKRMECVYESMKIYPYHPWCNYYYMTDEPTLENIKKHLPLSKYDRCVYDLNNNVCDHQSTIMLFESGAICTHSLSAFSKNVYRTIHIQGTLGELTGKFDEYNDIIEVNKFNGDDLLIDTKKLVVEESAHGGGDAAMMKEVFEVLNGKDSITITSIEQSIMSHRIAFKAEESRINNGETKLL